MKPEKAPYPGEVRKAAPRGTASIFPPEKDLAGRYVGSLANQGALSGEERHAVRKLLAEAAEPLLLTQIAQAAGMQLTRADRISNLANFVEIELVKNGEVEMKYKPAPRGGGERFAGWGSTFHGKSLVAKGLA